MCHKPHENNITVLNNIIYILYFQYVTRKKNKKEPIRPLFSMIYDKKEHEKLLKRYTK